MLAKRIIPCLDVKDGKTVKGVNFVNFRDAGDPVALGKKYSEQGADELVFLDITASHEGRKTFTEIAKKVAENINIPFTVGGGIYELTDVERLLAAGADKISVGQEESADFWAQVKTKAGIINYVPRDLKFSPPFLSWDYTAARLSAIYGAAPGKVKISAPLYFYGKGLQTSVQIVK